MSASLKLSAVETATSYRVQYKRATDRSWKEKSTEDLEITIDGLDEDTEYMFRVAANNDVGLSDYSEKTETIKLPGTSHKEKIGICIVAAKPTAPSKPVSPSVTDTTDSSATVQLKKVDGATSYTVKYKKAGHREWKEVETTDLELTIDGLEADEEYSFKVAANNEIGQSDDSRESLMVRLPRSFPNLILQMLSKNI